MKLRYMLACCAALVPAAFCLPASAGTAPHLWTRPGPFVGAAAPRHAGAAPAVPVGVRNVGPLGVASLPWTEQMVTADDWAAGDLYGYSTAVSGNTVFVAAPGATIGGNVDEGAVYVYRRSGGAWTQVQKLTPSDGAAGDEFGIHEAVEGNTLLVGSANSGGTGAVYVFMQSGGTWTQTQRFTPADNPVGGGFGYYVAMQGNVAVVTAPGVATATGAAYVFTDFNDTWTQAQKLTAGDGQPNDFFGQSAGISGLVILVGQDDVNAGPDSPQGAAYVFTNSGGDWIQTQKLMASDGGTGDGFGLDLSLFGSTALISAAYEPVSAVNYGAAYVFDESDGSWTQAQKLVGPTDAGPDQFGNSVALVGNTALIGSPVASATDFGSGEGAAYVFTKSGGTWQRTLTLTATDPGPGELFGFAAALAGNKAVATSIPDYGGGAGPDAAYVFSPHCPQGYRMQTGTLGAGGIRGFGSYAAPAGEENAILGTFAELDLYLLYSNGGYPHVVRVPGNEVHRHGPAGVYAWGAKDIDGRGGAYTFCSMHP